jgi:hypothetical protein
MTDHITRYITEMFRFHARTGGLKAFALAHQISAEQAAFARGESLGVQSGLSDPTAAAYGRMCSESKEGDLTAQYLDLLAVEQTLAIIGRLNRSREMCRAIERVYFLDADRPIEWGDIKGRVVAASLWMPASERAIYSWLADARAIAAQERGLRLEEWQLKRLRRMLL